MIVGLNDMIPDLKNMMTNWVYMIVDRGNTIPDLSNMI
jgi:hypothetical protein